MTNTKRFMALLLALFLAQSANAQIKFQVGVFDAETGAPIPNAFVSETVSGQIEATSTVGFCEFPGAFPGGAVAEVQVYAVGYPMQYREFQLNSGNDSDNISEYRPVYLYAGNEYLSPPIGVSGGQKAISHGTGQMVTDLSGTLIGEYFQNVSATIPQGALPFPVRIGFTPIKQTAWNVQYFDRDLSPSWRIGAQCQMAVFDLNGIEIASPALASPVRVTMDPGYYFDYQNLEGWTVVAYHFDEINLAWTTSGISNSGMTPAGEFWADLNVLQNISFMLVPPSSLSSSGEPEEVTCYYGATEARDSNCSEGSPLVCAQTDCPTGVQGDMDWEEDKTVTDKMKTDWAVSLGNTLTQLVGKVEGGSSDEVDLSYDVKLKNHVSEGGYASWDGKVCMRTSGRVFERTWYCEFEVGTPTAMFTEKQMIVTGTQVCKQADDGDGDGEPDGKPCPPPSGG